jgi:hypothetical protein
MNNFGQVKEYGQEALGNISQNLSSVGDRLSSTYNNAATSVSGLKDNLTGTFDEFSSKSVGDASTEFLQSNTLIARFAFIIIVIFFFVILLRLGIYLIGYFTESSNNPYLVKGMIPGTNNVTISQDPANSNAVPLLRSTNQPTGIEFTWSVWLSITGVDASNGNYQHIFNKGNNIYDSHGIATINNAPGVYLSKKVDPNNTGTTQTNAYLHIVMDTVDGAASQVIDVDNIPLKKWFHLAIRMENKVMDVYVNGVISARSTFTSVPKQNFNDVYVCDSKLGFSGNLSNLRYYNHALNVFEVNNIVMWGPNTKNSALSSVVGASSKDTSYLSSSWYMSKL